MMLILKHIAFAYSYQDYTFVEKHNSENFEEITFKNNYTNHSHKIAVYLKL